MKSPATFEAILIIHHGKIVRFVTIATSSMENMVRHGLCLHLRLRLWREEVRVDGLQRRVIGTQQCLVGWLD
jgi:hypothetical protein